MKATLITLLFGCLLAYPHPAKAEVTKPSESTNSSPNLLIEYMSKNHVMQKKKDPHTEFWPALSDSIEKRGNVIVSDKIGYFSQLKLSVKYTELRHDYLRYHNELGKDAVSDSIRDGLREILAERLPVEAWEESGRTLLERHIGPFLRGSIGNTEEERMEIVSSEPQSRSLERSWWKEIREDDTGFLSYGAKVLRPDPYLYTSIGFGRIERRPVILDLRVYSMLLDDKIGNPKVKVGMMLPTGPDSHLIFGCSLYPLDMGLDEDRSRGSLRYEKVVFRNHRRTTFWSAGVETNSKSTLVSIMVTSTW